MNHLPSSILNLLGFTSGGRRQGKRMNRDGEDEDEEGDMTSMVKRIVMEQHRTMFYTVTLSPQSQRKSISQQKDIAPSLKVIKNWEKMCKKFVWKWFISVAVCKQSEQVQDAVGQN